ncbi:MAG TPA: MOSC N-terminal beta barrel domain-containing protein [Pirellulales bacterium]|nr:MOSC N-terminal beta barrel domain-containing protein [Pirellulales bacterium]
MTYRLSRIVIYPIKSLDGVELEAATILSNGALANDRRFCLRNARGEWINGKATAAVHLLRAKFDRQASRVHLLSERDGRQAEFALPADAEGLAAWLGEFFGEKVLVVENLRGGFPDDTDSPGPTIVSRETIGEVTRWYPGFTVDEVRCRFRANLEFAGDAPFCEDRLVADRSRVVRFSIGAVIFEGTTACARCPVPTRHPQTGVIYPRFAKLFAEHREATLPPWTITERFDHYYRLTVNTRLSPLSQGGEIHVGDQLRILETVPA